MALKAAGLFNSQYLCPVCHLGHFQLRLTVYVRMFGETLIHVPNMPAWECDVCHHRQFEPASIQRVEALVGQAGPPPNRYRPRDVQPTHAPDLGVKPKPQKAPKPRPKAK